MTTYSNKAEIKYIGCTLPGIANTAIKIANYPSGTNIGNIFILCNNTLWESGEWHWNRYDVVILTKSDGIYVVCTSAEVLNRSFNIIYSTHL